MRRNRKVIRLTESDLTRLIRQVIKENVGKKSGDFYSDINDLIDTKYSDLETEEIIDVLSNVLNHMKGRMEREKRTGKKYDRWNPHFNVDLTGLEKLVKRTNKLGINESDLVKLVKPVISEQAIEEDKNKVLKTFLNSIQRGGYGDKSRWVLDANNPDRRRGGDVKLTGKEFLMLKSYIDTPLTWSLEVDGVKEEDAVFQIFSNKDGELYYQVYSSVKPGVKNTSGYEKLTMDNVSEAIDRFNQRVKM